MYAIKLNSSEHYFIHSLRAIAANSILKFEHYVPYFRNNELDLEYGMATNHKLLSLEEGNKRYVFLYDDGRIVYSKPQN